MALNCVWFLLLLPKGASEYMFIDLLTASPIQFLQQRYPFIFLYAEIIFERL